MARDFDCGLVRVMVVERSRRMSRRLLALAGAMTVALSLAYISWPVGHIPPYDANLVRLAESDLQGFCSGDAFWKSEGQGSANLASECRKKLAGQRPNRPNMMAVQPAFCEAILANGWEGVIQDCLTIMQENEYWPTYDGSITNQWNRARAYPQPWVSSGPASKSDGSRTGQRPGVGRANSPTHQAPTYP